MAKLELRRGSLLAGAFFSYGNPKRRGTCAWGLRTASGSGDYVAASALTQACAVPRSLRFPELTLRALAGLGTPCRSPIRLTGPVICRTAEDDFRCEYLWCDLLRRCGAPLQDTHEPFHRRERTSPSRSPRSTTPFTSSLKLVFYDRSQSTHRSPTSTPTIPNIITSISRIGTSLWISPRPI